MWSGGINNKNKASKKSVESLRYRAISDGQRCWDKKGTESERHQEWGYFRFSCQLNYFSSVVGSLTFKRLKKYTYTGTVDFEMDFDWPISSVK